MESASTVRDPIAEINALVTATGYNADGALRTQYLGIDTVCPSPSNPRKHFGAASMAELVDSVKRHGVLEPILVRPWPSDYAHNPSPLPFWELVAGERRWRAAKEAGAQLIEAKVRHLTDREMLEIMVIENLQREGLTPLEEAEGYETMHRDYGYSADDIAEKIGKSKAYVYGRMKLTALCHAARKALADDKISASIALVIARIPVTALQEQATLDISSANWQGDAMSYRKAVDYVQRKYMLKLTDAPFPVNDGKLLPSAGTCKLCPKRTGNAPGLFDDVKNANVCTDPECYQAKTKAHKDSQIKAAKDTGIKVVVGKEAEKIMPYGADNPLNGGFVALDGTVWVDGKQRTYRDIIAAESPTIALVEDKRSGAMVQVVETKQIAEALKAAGINRGTNLANTRQLDEEKRAKAETEYRRRLHAAIRARRRVGLEQGRADIEPHETIMIAQMMFDRVGSDYAKHIIRLWAPTEEKIEWHNRIHAFQRDAIPALSQTDLWLLLIDLAVIGETSVNTYQLEGKPTKLLALAAHLDISPSEIKKAVAAEAKAKGSKAKPAAETQVAKPAKGGTKVGHCETPEAKSETPATIGGIRIGERVRIKPDATWADGKKIKGAGEAGIVQCWTHGYLTVRFDDGIAISNLAQSHVEVIESAPAETPSTPVGAARADDEGVMPAAPAEGEGQTAAKPKAPRKTKVKGDLAPAAPSNEPATPAGGDVAAEGPIVKLKKGKRKDDLAPAMPTNETPSADASGGDDDLGIKAITTRDLQPDEQARLPDTLAWPFPARARA